VWLANHLNTNSATLSFENGFSFSVLPDMVFKILGFPCGPKVVQKQATREATNFIHHLVHMENPTVDYPCSLLLMN
jgi:hypothetical protein